MEQKGMSTLGGVPKSFFFSSLSLFQEIGYTHSNAEGNCIGEKKKEIANPTHIGGQQRWPAVLS
jgi:hypothetical protein